MMNTSWATSYNRAQAVARFPRMELPRVDIYATFPEISHVFSGSAAKVLWTVQGGAATILITRV
jgi:hypothetical protein